MVSKRYSTMRSGATGLLLAVCLASLAPGLPATAGPCPQDPAPRPEPTPEERAASRERRLRATFLKHFAQLVTWPDEVFESEEQPFVIGVVGPDPLCAELDEVMAELEIEGRTVRVRRFGRFAGLEDPTVLRGCQVLLVAEPDPIVQGRIVEVLSESSTLTVSDALGFADAGGGIQTFVAENKPRFEVNREVLEQVALRPSSKLLKLSRPAPKRPEPGRR